MLLSDVIASLDRDGAAAELVLRLGDLVLLQNLQARAKEEGLTLEAYVSSAVRRYGDTAGDDEWVSLLGALARSDDPGAVYLRRALEKQNHHVGSQASELDQYLERAAQQSAATPESGDLH